MADRPKVNHLRRLFAEEGTKPWCSRGGDDVLANARGRAAADAVYSVFKKTSYKPGWRCWIVAYADRVGVFLEQWVTDVHYGERIPVRSSFAIAFETAEQVRDPRSMLRLLRSNIHSFELHEADEWFKYEGVCVVDPHKKHAGCDGV